MATTTTSTPSAEELYRQQIQAALDVKYGSQAQKLAADQESILAAIDAANRTAEMNYNSTAGTLKTQQEKDLSNLLKSHENAQLKMGGGYSSWLNERAQNQQADVAQTYAQKQAEALAAKDNTMATNSAQRALYAKQTAEQLASLDTSKQSEYVSMLNQFLVQQIQTQEEFERNKELASMGGSGGGGGSDDALLNTLLTLLNQQTKVPLITDPARKSVIASKKIQTPKTALSFSRFAK